VCNRPAFVLAIVLTAHAGLVGWAATRHSPCYDEVGHLGAGLSHWGLGTLDAYNVNPPLVRLVATLPLALAGVEGSLPSRMNCEPPYRPEFKIGDAFISAHGEQAFAWVAVARWACLPFSLLGAWACYLWARDLYGRWPGVFAATLWCTSPIVLGLAELITPDAPAASTGLAACYLFWRWLRQPTGARAVAAGLVLGVALLCKSTWMILLGLWPLTWFAWEVMSWARGHPPNWWRKAGQLALAFALAIGVINLGYGFENTGVRLGSYRFFSTALTSKPLLVTEPMQITPPSGNRFEGTWVGGIPVPLPANYLYGIDVQRLEFEIGHRSYLCGEWRHGGWWYYYLYGLLVKTPLATLALFGLALVTWPFVRPPGRTWRDELTLVAPGVVILALVSSQTGFNHHLRYVLPALPFAFVWMSRLAAAGCRSLRVAAWVALAATAAASLWVYPHSLSYFNVAAGGPTNGSAHMLDSNVDWGQDLIHLKEWVDAHPEARPLGLAYYGRFSPTALGLECALPPPLPTNRAAFQRELLGPLPGWYAVSVNLLRGQTATLQTGDGEIVTASDGEFEYFRRFTPVGRAGYSIYIYHFDRDECNRVRAGLGLPAIN